MADEAIRISCQFSVQDTALGLDARNQVFDQVADGRYMSGVQTIGTTEEALDYGDLADAESGYFHNRGDYPIQIGVKPAATFYATLEIPAGAAFPCWVATRDLFAKAIGGDADLEYGLVAP